jgi:hypothetical protein
MKSKLIKLLMVGAVVAFAGSSVPVQAISTPLNGAISFSDQFTANNTVAGNLSDATALTSITGVRVSSSSGDYTLGSIVNGTTPVSFAGVTIGTPFIFIPSTAFAGLWSIVDTLGNTYSFDVTATTFVNRSVQTIALSGTGTASITGPTLNRAATAGTWNLTLNQNGSLLNFSGGAASSVPDGGTTVLLLGAALSTLALIKRRLA